MGSRWSIGKCVLRKNRYQMGVKHYKPWTLFFILLLLVKMTMKKKTKNDDEDGSDNSEDWFL